MGNKINIGNNNRMKDTNIAGNNAIISKECKKNLAAHQIGDKSY